MASVTSGLSAADSQNIIRATDALNKLTRSINSLEITNRELVKSTIRFNALNKSIDNLDRRINQVRTSFTKIENKKTTQAVNSHSSGVTKKSIIDEAASLRDPHQTDNAAANAIRQSFIDKDIFINSRDLYKPSNANIQKDIIDSIAAISGMAGPELSVPVSLISIQAKRMIDDNEDARNYERNKISGFLSDYSNLENYKSYDEFDRQRSTLETAEKMQSVLLGQVDEISKAIEKLNKNKKNLSAGSTASAVDEFGNIFSYNIPARPELIPKIDSEIYELEKQEKKANRALDATKGMVEEVKNNVANAFKIPSILNLEGILADPSKLSDSNTTNTNTQTSITSFESGRYQFDSFRESSRSSRYGTVQVAADYESSSERKSAEFSSAQSIARDLTAKPKSAEDLINERTEQQFKDIENLNTYAQSTEDYRLYQEARVEIAAQASEARQSIRQNEEQMDRQATLNGLNDMNSAVTGLMGIAEAARGKQSGTNSMMVKDENGDGQRIYFSRPTQRMAWIRVNVTGLYDEEVLPQGVINSIKKAVMSYGERLNIGDDIILQRMLGPIYSNTSGLATITIEAAITDSADDQPDYQLENIAIDKRSFALFDEARLEVIGL